MKNTSADPLTPHSHDPNPSPPSDDPGFTLITPDGITHPISVAQLRGYPTITVADCTIVSTGHGASGPFTFAGVRLGDLLRAWWPGRFSQVEVISGDGFGTRLLSRELNNLADPRPILLAHTLDGVPLSRSSGLVRLIVPTEVDDALRQVKWVATIRILVH